MRAIFGAKAVELSALPPSSRGRVQRMVISTFDELRWDGRKLLIYLA